LRSSARDGYVTTPALALPGEPEAVDEPTQRRFSAAGHRRDGERARETWQRARGRIIEGIEIANQSASTSAFSAEICTRGRRSKVTRATNRRVLPTRRL
jgi:hypothetical protein